MSAGRSNVMLPFIVAGLLFIGLLWLARWPLWASIILALVSVMAIVTLERLVRWFRQGREPPLGPGPEPHPVYVPAAPVENKEESLTEVRLPSRDADYGFLFSARVLWLPVGSAVDESSVNLSALAVDAVLRRAREVTEQCDPSHVSLVRHELGRVLGEMQGDGAGRLRAMARSVQLALPVDDQQRLEKLAGFRKDEAVWEHERSYERSKRDYLSTDALKTPGSAVVWWLARNNEQLEKTVQDIDLLSKLTAAANNTATPDFSPPPIPGDGAVGGADFNGWIDRRHPEDGGPADYFDAFLRAVNLADGDPERGLFARRVARLMDALGRPEVADEMMRRFDMSAGSEYSRETTGVGYPEEHDPQAPDAGPLREADDGD